VDTEIIITQENVKEELENLFPIVCQILGVDEKLLTKPTILWTTSELLEVFGIYSDIGYHPGDKIILICKEATIRRGQLAHEIGHCVAMQNLNLPYGDSEEWAQLAETEIAKL